MTNGTLTGKYYHKPNIFGNLVLWVEVEAHTPQKVIFWRKAEFTDIPYLNFN